MRKKSKIKQKSFKKVSKKTKKTKKRELSSRRQAEINF